MSYELMSPDMILSSCVQYHFLCVKEPVKVFSAYVLYHMATVKGLHSDIFVPAYFPESL